MLKAIDLSAPAQELDITMHVREVRRKEAEIVNNRFASALTENKYRDFWQEAKRIRNSKIRLV